VVRLRHEAGRLLCDRDWEGGMRETLELPVPALATIQAGHYAPRYPSLSNILKAAAVASRIITAAEPALAGTEPDAIFLAPIEPEKTRAGRMVGGGIQAQVGIFTSFLQERAFL